MTELRDSSTLQFNLGKLQKIDGRLAIKGNCKLCKAEFIGYLRDGVLGWQGQHRLTCPKNEAKFEANQSASGAA